MKYEEEITLFANNYIVPWSINILSALLVFFIGRIAINLVSNLLGKVLTRTRLDVILVEFVQALVRALLLVFVIVAALDQLGVNTTSVIAILGAAGLAIGLALQGSLQNFAAGFMLLIFRPFKAGDYIEAGGTAGVVEKISIFSTIMRTADNKEVTVPNGAIYSGNIVNSSARSTRRIDLVFSIGYANDIRKARNIIESVINAEGRILPEPKPIIGVSELTTNSVNITVLPWVKAADYGDVKFALLENIKQAFDENGVSIPVPQMEMHWVKPEIDQKINEEKSIIENSQSKDN